MSLKSFIKNIIPKFAKNWLLSIRLKKHCFFDYFYDMKRYITYSGRLYSGLSTISFEEMESIIFLFVHSIEKGLSFERRRSGFGKRKAKALVNMLKKYVDKGFPAESTCFSTAVAVLSEYLSFQKQYSTEDMNCIEEFLESVQKIEIRLGGTMMVTSSQLMKQGKGDFASLSQSRHSIRSFSEKPVEIETIIKAVELAQRSPSVCNRQASRTHVVADKVLIEKILSIQGGTKGFEESIDKIIIVTSCLQMFRDSSERNQPFVDGGIYSMNLLLALHYYGLGACPLSWGRHKKQDLQLRSIIDIPDNENVILMIAVGNLKEEFLVTVSLRKTVEEVVKIHSHSIPTSI